MREEMRAKRQEQIEAAAYALLEEKGYAATSMLEIAKKSKASNETLYRWYGNKKGLFKSLVETNAAEIKKLLETDLSNEASPTKTLSMLGPKLLGVLVSRKAITLNRVAATDPTGELGKALSASGRETILPLVRMVFGRMLNEEHASDERVQEVVETYIGLLVGDLQIRRVIGVKPELKQSEINSRAKSALSKISRLLER